MQVPVAAQPAAVDFEHVAVLLDISHVVYAIDALLVRGVAAEIDASDARVVDYPFNAGLLFEQRGCWIDIPLPGREFAQGDAVRCVGFALIQCAPGVVQVVVLAAIEPAVCVFGVAGGLTIGSGRFIHTCTVFIPRAQPEPGTGIMAGSSGTQRGYGLFCALTYRIAEYG